MPCTRQVRDDVHHTDAQIMLEQSAELGTVSGESTHGDCREGRLAVYCACDGARSGAGKANARGETTEESTCESDDNRRHDHVSGASG